MTTDSLYRLRWRDSLSLWALAFAASSLIGTHGIAYWDSGDYVLLSIQGGKSGLLLGRPLFLWISHAILSTGVDAAHAEPVLRWFWSAAGALAAPLMALLALRLGLERRAALAAGVAMALSPSFAHTSHQVLTDAPALALSIAALVSAASGDAWRAGLILAAAVATRETALVHVVSIAVLLGRRDAPKAVATLFVMLALVIGVNRPPGVAQWFASMSQSIATHSWSVRDLLTSLVWIAAAGPLPVATGMLTMFRGSMNARVRAVAVPAAIATVLLALYPDGSFSPRYVLAAAPLAFFLPAAPWLAARPRAASIVLLISLCAGAVGVLPADAVARQGATLIARVPELPANTLVVPGHFCPQARLAAATARRPDLEFVCPGWDWPADLGQRLDSTLGAGRPVAVDVTDEAWVGPREAVPRGQARAWAASRAGDTVAGFKLVAR